MKAIFLCTLVRLLAIFSRRFVRSFLVCAGLVCTSQTLGALCVCACANMCKVFGTYWRRTTPDLPKEINVWGQLCTRHLHTIFGKKAAQTASKTEHKPKRLCILFAVQIALFNKPFFSVYLLSIVSNHILTLCKSFSVPIQIGFHCKWNCLPELNNPSTRTQKPCCQTQRNKEP